MSACASTRRCHQVRGGSRLLGLAEASVHFVPLHLHPYFQKEWGYREGQFPVAERAFSEIISLPMHQGMSDDDTRFVSSVVKKALGG